MYKKLFYLVRPQILKHHLYLFLFPVLILLHIKFYPDFKFPNMDFAISSYSNSKGKTYRYKDIKEQMKPLEVHQSMYLIRYFNDEKFNLKAEEFLNKKIDKCYE